MGFSRAIRVNVTVGGDAIATQMVSSFVYDGETYMLDDDHPVGFFEDGRPFIVSNGGGRITGTSTPASDIQGDGNVGNGMMKNPWFGSSQVQGFDQYLAAYPQKFTFETEYDPALNVDPGASDTATWIAGEEATFVKAFRHPAATGVGVNHQMHTKYHHIAIVSQAPPVGTVGVGAAHTVKRFRSVNDVVFAPRGYVLPASWGTVAEIMANVPDDLGLFNGGDTGRRLRIDNDLGTTNDGYSAEVVDHYARFIYALNSSEASATQRAEMIRKILFFANQVEGVLDSGGSLNFGAGQGGAIWLWPMAAAALLRDDALHQKVRGVMQPDTPFWITAANVGVPANGKSGVAAQTYFEEHIGMPHVEPDETGTHHAARYFNVASYIIAWEAAAICGFNQGPPGFANGVEMLLNGGPNDETNPRAAILGLMARYETWTPNPQSSYGTPSTWVDVWAQIKSFGEFTPWTGAPEQPPMGDAGTLNDDYFSAGNGLVLLDTQGIDFTTEPVTRSDIRYSLDNVQFIELSDINITGFTFPLNGLLRGVSHWCGWRRHSASGVSPWSGNHPYTTPVLSGNDRAKVTTTGSEAAAAPVNTVAPVIHARKYPGWAYAIWEAKSGVLPTDDVELAAGVGYWSGFPAPDFAGGDFTFQWRRNGAAIPGATSKIYTRMAADAGAVLTCDVTCSTSQGSVTLATSGVTCPAIQSPPAGTLIDTNFRGAFAIDYEPEFNSLAGSNYTVSHEPALSPINQGESFGALRFKKESGNPSGGFDLSRLTQASTSYDVVAELAIDGDTISNRGDFFFELLDGTGTVLFASQTDGALVQAGDDNSMRVPITGTLTTGTNTDLSLRVRWSNNTGGGSGGDVYVTQLRIVLA